MRDEALPRGPARSAPRSRCSAPAVAVLRALRATGLPGRRICRSLRPCRLCGLAARSAFAFGAALRWAQLRDLRLRARGSLGRRAAFAGVLAVDATFAVGCGLALRARRPWLRVRCRRRLGWPPVSPWQSPSASMQPLSRAARLGRCLRPLASLPCRPRSCCGGRRHAQLLLSPASQGRLFHLFKLLAFSRQPLERCSSSRMSMDVSSSAAALNQRLQVVEVLLGALDPQPHESDAELLSIAARVGSRSARPGRGQQAPRQVGGGRIEPGNEPLQVGLGVAAATAAPPGISEGLGRFVPERQSLAGLERRAASVGLSSMSVNAWRSSGVRRPSPSRAGAVSTAGRIGNRPLAARQLVAQDPLVDPGQLRQLRTYESCSTRSGSLRSRSSIRRV